MKVLHVLQGTVGGSIELVNLLTQQLKLKGYCNTVACPRSAALREKCIASGIEWVELDMCREISPIKDIRAVISLMKIIKEQKCDILHAHSSKAGAVGRIAAWLKGVPCVYTAHGWSFNMNVSRKKRIFYRIVERFFSYITGMITCISQQELESAISAGFNPKKLKRIDNGVDLERYNIKEDVKVLKERLNIPKDKVIIGMVARITEQKDPFFFLEIARETRRRVKDSFFVLVGDGEMRAQVEERINSSGDIRDAVNITGWVETPEFYIKCFDIGILTSKWEGFGLVLVEYMASKIPIVATNVDGIPCVIKDGYSGLLCESGNIKGFADNICRLLDDKVLTEALVNNAHKEAHNKFSIENTAMQYEEVYKKTRNSIRSKNDEIKTKGIRE
jgi:glycosyltransferase involved in cell wall biosynthesis